MGCCLSRSSGPNSPYPGGDPAPAGGLDAPTLTLPPDALTSAHMRCSADHQRGSNLQSAAESTSLHQHINKPLRRHRWASVNRWTRPQLDREREEFFDTRVTGRQEIWQTVHAALQILWEQSPADSCDDAPDGLDTAQTILLAAEISLPTGDLVNGVYDSLGNYYQLPEWVVSDPDNLYDESHDDGTKIESRLLDSQFAKPDQPVDTQGDSIDDGNKGKAIASATQLVVMRARLSESGKDVEVTVQQSDSVKIVAGKIAERSDLPPNKRIRLAYMGKILQENTDPTTQGWQEGHILNALVFDA